MYILHRPDFASGKELSLLGGRHCNKLRAWRLPFLMASSEGLIRFYGRDNVRMSDQVKKWYDSPTGFPLKPMEEVSAKIQPEIWNTLHAYQKDAVQFLYS